LRQLLQHRKKLGKPFPPDLIGPLVLEASDSLARRTFDRPPPRRKPNHLGTAISKVGDALEVATLLQMVHQVLHGLLRHAGALGQLGYTRALTVQILKHHVVSKAYVLKTRRYEGFMDAVVHPVNQLP